MDQKCQAAVFRLLGAEIALETPDHHPGDHQAVVVARAGKWFKEIGQGHSLWTGMAAFHAKENLVFLDPGAHDHGTWTGGAHQQIE
jgi:hypothetical protein